MKILVPTKRVPDPDQRIRVRDDARGIDESNVTFVINPFDAIALEEAVQIQERSPFESHVLAVGIGTDDYEEQLREALAMGADQAVLVECDEPLDPWHVAQILRSMVDREQPDIVLMGKQAIDDDANQCGQFLAALLDWPQATFASKIEFLDVTGPEGIRGSGGPGVRVSRETDRGIEVVLVTLPAVITTDLRLNEPRYVSLPSMLKAKKKKIERLGLQDLGVVIHPRVQVLEMEVTTTHRSGVKVSTVDELIEKLCNEAKVI